MNKPISYRPFICCECGCSGYHKRRCPEGERQWELIEMERQEDLEEQLKKDEECDEDGEGLENGEEIKAVNVIDAIAADFVSVYGRKEM